MMHGIKNPSHVTYLLVLMKMNEIHLIWILLYLKLDSLKLLVPNRNS